MRAVHSIRSNLSTSIYNPPSTLIIRDAIVFPEYIPQKHRDIHKKIQEVMDVIGKTREKYSLTCYKLRTTAREDKHDIYRRRIIRYENKIEALQEETKTLYSSAFGTYGAKLMNVPAVAIPIPLREPIDAVEEEEQLDIRTKEAYAKCSAERLINTEAHLLLMNATLQEHIERDIPIFLSAIEERNSLLQEEAECRNRLEEEMGDIVLAVRRSGHLVNLLDYDIVHMPKECIPLFPKIPQKYTMQLGEFQGSSTEEVQEVEQREGALPTYAEVIKNLERYPEVTSAGVVPIVVEGSEENQPAQPLIRDRISRLTCMPFLPPRSPASEWELPSSTNTRRTYAESLQAVLEAGDDSFLLVTNPTSYRRRREEASQVGIPSYEEVVGASGETEIEYVEGATGGESTI